jgi:four helix bundle protein
MSNVVVEKSHHFALRIVRLYKYLCDEQHEYVLSKQVLLAGTYVGAHVKEATRAESRAVFINEMAIALRKASETEYWLQLLHEGAFLETKAFESINADCIELIKLLTSIVKTSRTTDEL